MRSLQWTAVFGTGYELPPSVGKETVIGAGDELCSVFQSDPIRALGRRPMRQYLCLYVVTVRVTSLRSIYRVTYRDLFERFRTTVGHQHLCVSTHAISARMGASSVWVDRPVEGEEVAGDLVDDGFRFGLDELDAAEVRRVERPSPKLEDLVTAHPDIVSNVCSCATAGAGQSNSGSGRSSSGIGFSRVRCGSASTDTIAPKMRTAPNQPAAVNVWPAST